MITLDGYADNHFGLIPLQNHSHPINTGIQHKMIIIPGVAGAHDAGSELTVKYFDFEFAIKEQNETTAQTKLKEFVTFLCDDTGRPRDIKLIFDYEPGKYYTVKLNSIVDPERIRGFSRFSISFIASDPYKYSASSRVENLTGTVSNGGNCKTKGIITIEITEPISNLNITLQNTGEFISVTHNFVIGDIVRIDLKEEMVYKNGESIMYDCVLESDFFYLPIGEFVITVSSGNAMLEFTERWL